MNGMALKCVKGVPPCQLQLLHNTDIPQTPSNPPPVSEASKRAAPTFFGTTEGAVNFNVSVRVDMGEFASWKPERIAAFFNGMAQVLAAKADVEKSGSEP